MQLYNEYDEQAVSCAVPNPYQSWRTEVRLSGNVVHEIVRGDEKGPLGRLRHDGSDRLEVRIPCECGIHRCLCVERWQVVSRNKAKCQLRGDKPARKRRQVLE